MEQNKFFTAVKKLLKIQNFQAAIILFFSLIIFFSSTIFSSKINSASDILQNWPIFSFEKNYTPQNNLFSDPVVQSEPWFKFAKDSLKSGQIPLWNPYQGNGTPHIANMQSAFFYPLNWLVFLFNFKIGLLLLYFFKFYLVGIFTYFYLRQIKINHYASIIGAVAFMFCQYNVDWLYWPIVNVVFFLPLSFFLIEKILVSRKNLFVWLYAISIAIALFGGHPETFIHISLASFLYFFFRLQVLDNLAKSKIKLVFDFVKAHLFGVLLAGVQVIPFYEYMVNSSSFYGRTFTENPFNLPFPLASLNFIPDLFGNPAFHEYFLKISNYNESNGGYVGLTMLFLSVLSLVWFYKQRLVQFFTFLAIFSFAIVYKMPFIYQAFTSLPIFNKLANHRMLFLFAFSMVVMGTYFLSELFEGKISFSKKKLILNWVIFAFLTIFLSSLSFKVLYSSFRNIDNHMDFVRNVAIFFGVDLLILLCVFLLLKNSKHLFWGVLVLVFLETGFHGLFYQPVIKPNYFFPNNSALYFLKLNSNLQRVTSVSGSAHIPPNVATYYELSDIKNYDAMLLRNYKKELDAHSTNIENFQSFDNVDRGYLDLTGVKYIVSKSQKELTKKLSLKEADLNLYPSVFSGNDFEIFENKNVFPRAFLVEPSKLQADLLLKQDIISDKKNYAEIKEYKPNKITIETSNSNQSSLILTDSYYPGWKAYVDGVEKNIIETASSFRAVELESGRHEVVFEYQPLSFKIGSLISLVTLILISFCLFKQIPKKTKKIEG